MKLYKKALSILFAAGFSLMPLSEAFAIDNNTTAVVSIFDAENSKTNQYGASQKVFGIDPDKLIEDSYVWNAMQEYYPEENYESRDEAIALYKSYFKIISDYGCGPAAACDVVFKAYEGREEEFLEAFGYPMYEEIDGHTYFNYPYLLLDFFNFTNLKMKNRYDEVDKVTRKDMYRFALDSYINSEEYKRRKPENMTDEEYDAWEKFDKERIEKYRYLYNRWDKEPVTKINFGIPVDAAFGYLYVFLAEKHITCEIWVEDKNIKYNVGDIIAAEGYHLYLTEEEQQNEDAYHANFSRVSSHYVYVTEITDDGKIIVSSWGKRYILDMSQATWEEKVVLKLTLPNK